MGFQAENLYRGPAFPAEMQPGRHHLGVIEDHYGVVGKQSRKISEYMFSDARIAEFKQFGLISLLERIFRNPGIRKLIVVILDVYIDRHL